MNRNKTLHTATAPLGGRLLCYILSFLILLGSFSISANATSIFKASFADAESVGSIGELPLKKTTVDGSNYDTLEFSPGHVLLTVQLSKGESLGENTDYGENAISKTEASFIAGQNYFSEKESELNSAGISINTEENEYLLFLKHTFSRGKVNTIDGFWLIEWTKGTVEAIETGDIKAAITSAEAVTSDSHYTSGDRYNGKSVDTIVDVTSGFFSQMQAVLGSAKQLFEENNPESDLKSSVIKSDVETATTNLTTAIDKLIPITRVNATGLYEEIELQKTKNEALYTTASWADFADKLSAANDMLEMLYEDGKPTVLNIAVAGDDDPVGAIYQVNVDQMTNGLKDAAAALKVATTDESAETANITVNSIVNLYNFTEGLSPSDYTSGWEDFQAARSAAYNYYTENGKVAADSYVEIEKEYGRLYQAFYDAYYYGLTNKAESITVSVRTADNLALKNEKFLDTQWQHYQSEQLTLTSDHTVNGLLSELSMASVDSSTLAIFVNGVLIRDWDNIFNEAGFLNAQNSKYKNIVLRDGDEVVLARLPYGEGLYYINPFLAPLRYTKDFLALARFDNASGEPLGLDTMTVREGEPFTLYASKAAAAMDSYSNKRTPMPNATLFVSKSGVVGEGSNAALSPTVNTGVVTDSSGKAELFLYGEGWFQVFAVDLRADQFSETIGSVDDVRLFPTLTVGASIWVYVEPLEGSDLTGAVTKVKTELEDYYAALNEKVFTEAQWQSATEDYETAIGAISTATSLTEARNACDTAIGKIDALLAEIDRNNKNTLNKLTTTLSWLPDTSGIAAGNFTKYYIERFSDVKALYESLTEYQKEQLTGIQEHQYQALLSEFGEDGSGLPDAKNYKITVEADKHAEEFDVLYRQYYTRSYDGGNIEDRSINEVDYDLIGGSTFDFIPGGAVTIYVAPVLSDGNDVNSYSNDYYITSIEVDGVDARVFNFPGKANFPLDGGNKLYRQTSGYVMLSLPTPDNDITITLSIRKVGEETLADKKELAKSELAAVYAGYDKALYTNTAWAELTIAYNTGLSNIDKATDDSGISAAKSNAQAAMSAIQTRELEAPGTEGAYGSVRVTVENTTYKGGEFTEVFVNEKVPLEAGTTMMTALLDALGRAGYSWSDSSGRGDDNIAYLSRIYLDTNKNGQYDKGSEQGLAEFDGGPMSGWMGTLNDWFVNEGFQSFSVNASNKNYRLVDGDHISIKYTSTGYGSDIGGTWGNSDTSLKGLNISGGKLMPNFSSGTHSYVMQANGGSVTVEPEAANKNYQVRTYLNETSGDNWYRRIESISVKAGDIINVGVGDRSWPSMNNQGAESISYSGTWYKIYIMNSSSSSVTQSLIDALPNASRITISNYKSYAEAVALAKAAQNIAAASNTARLTEAEARITFYEAIDSVKTLLAAISAAEKLTTADKSKVQAAYDAYIKLSDDQKLYITVGDVAKYAAAVEWLEKQGIDTPGAITGSDKAPEQPEASTTLAPAVTATNGTAAATVSSAEMNTAIADAKKNDSTAITIAPEITGTAKKVSVELPKASVSSIGTDTTADLRVETPVGSVTIPNDALASIASQASGDTVSVVVESVEQKNLSAEQQKLVGENPVFDISILSNGQKISSFDGKRITISLPYTLKDGETASGVTVWYLSDDGKLEQMSCTYDKTTGLATFTTTHLSNYVVGYDEWANPFTDVSGHWALEAIRYVHKNMLFTGTSDNTFSPNDNMTRAMFVTVLYRMENEPKTTAENSFTDVKDGQWYTNAVLWANENKLVEGYGNKLFGTNDPVTREQMAVLLNRYAKWKGLDVTKSDELAKYTDAKDISSWAETSMKWAVAEGLITGMTTTSLAPEGTATRAQVATILMRFLESRS